MGMIDVMQAMLIRWLLVVIDYMDAGVVAKLSNLYSLIFLLLDFTLLVHNSITHTVYKWTEFPPHP